MTPETYTPGCPRCLEARWAVAVRFLANLIAGAAGITNGLLCLVSAGLRDGGGARLSDEALATWELVGRMLFPFLLVVLIVVASLAAIARHLTRRANGPGLVRADMSDVYRASVSAVCPRHPPPGV